jgi:hypothetical protein
MRHSARSTASLCARPRGHEVDAPTDGYIGRITPSGEITVVKDRKIAGPEDRRDAADRVVVEIGELAEGSRFYAIDLTTGNTARVVR